MLLLVVHKPAPTAALDCRSALFKPLFELLKAVPGFEDESHKLCVVVWTVAVLGRTQTIPKKLVIEMAATVELECLGYFYRLGDVVLSLCFLNLLNQLVKVVYISAVVFAVMEV